MNEMKIMSLVQEAKSMSFVQEFGGAVEKIFSKILVLKKVHAFGGWNEISRSGDLCFFTMLFL